MKAQILVHRRGSWLPAVLLLIILLKAVTGLGEAAVSCGGWNDWRLAYETWYVDAHSTGVQGCIYNSLALTGPYYLTL